MSSKELFLNIFISNFSDSRGLSSMAIPEGLCQKNALIFTPHLDP